MFYSIQSILQKLYDFDCDSKVLDRMVVRMIEHCYHVTVRNERSLEGVVFKSTSDGIELGKFTHDYNIKSLIQMF